MNCLIWCSGDISSSGSYLDKNFCGFLGNGCVGPGMEITSIISQGLYAAMVLEKIEISQEDEIQVTRVFISESRVILERQRESVSKYQRSDKIRSNSRISWK